MRSGGDLRVGLLASLDPLLVDVDDPFGDRARSSRSALGGLITALRDPARARPAGLALLRSLQELLQAGRERADVAGDARVMIAGNDGNLDAGEQARPAEIRAMGR